MNKFLATSAVLAALSISTNAQSATRDSFPYWYLGLSGGAAFQKDSDISGSGNNDIEWDSGYVISASIGYQPPSLAGFRVEGELSQHRQDVSNGSGEETANVAAANLYYDFHNSSIFTPYIGGGLGFAKLKLGNTNSLGGSGDSDRFVYQGMAGIGFEPPSIPNVGFTLGYRYLAPFNDPRVHNADYEYDNHSVELGAKFRF